MNARQPPAAAPVAAPAAAPAAAVAAVTVAALLTGIATAQDPKPDTLLSHPVVQVSFAIDAYRVEYDGAKKAQLDAAVTGELITLLGRFPYLEFTDQPAPYVLSVTLAEVNREVQFSIVLRDTASGTETEPVRWTFRDADHITGDVTDLAGFREEIRLSFASFLESRGDDFTKSCLSEVPICKGGRHIGSTFVALPARCQDIKLDERNSQFRIWAKIRWKNSPATDQDAFEARGQGMVESNDAVLADWVGRIQALIVGRRGAGALAPEPNALVDSITITGVSVLVYRKGGACLAPVNPSALDLQ